MSVEPPAPDIILASSSPRRRYLLSRAGLAFRVVPSAVDEEALAADDPEAYVRALAEAKADEVAQRFPQSWVIGADTIVVVDGRILGKPRSEAEAKRMLASLSGRTHRVLTGWCVRNASRDFRFLDVAATEVLFKTLSPEEIDWYVGTGEPFDKAGAYAIQGIGTFLVRRIHGSYTNVVGLPVCEVLELLIRERVIGFDRAAGGANPGREGASAHG